MWKNDNFFIGALASLVVSMVTSVLIIFAGPPVYGLFSTNPPENRLILLSVFPAVFLMRYYMRKLRFEKAGMGTLAMVFLLMLLYFVFIENKSFSIFP